MWKCSCGHDNPNSARWCESCYAKGSDQPSYIAAIDKERKQKVEAELETKKKQQYAEQLERARVEAQERKRQEAEDQIAFLKANGHEGFYEYKVLDFNDNPSGSLNIHQLNDTLNTLGRQGWHLRSAFTNELGVNQSFGTNATMDQNVIIMERFIKFK